ncbi:hypothetical protein IIA79_03135, partial [bacterium]|nr:hypothetical protein [bacterium]
MPLTVVYEADDEYMAVNVRDLLEQDDIPVMIKPNVIAGFKVSDKLLDFKPTNPVMTFLNWLTHEAHGSAGTTIKRQVNQFTFQVARGVDTAISVPGVRGFDEELELVFRGLREDSELLLSVNANARSPLQLRSAQKMIDMFDETSELTAMRKIHPDNIGGLAREAHQAVWAIEYKRAMKELGKANPEWLSRQLQAESARVADKIASKPKFIARQIGTYYEEAWRASHRTGLGPQTLDDNIFFEFAKKIGQTENLEKLNGAFQLYYGT